MSVVEIRLAEPDLTDQRLGECVVQELSRVRGEPDWIADTRLQSLRYFDRLPMLTDGDGLSELNLEQIVVKAKTGSSQLSERSQPADSARDEAEVVFRRNSEDLKRQGVIFCDLYTAIREHPELVKPNLGNVVPIDDNKFAALNSSLWTGGSFVYVPPGIEVAGPLQVYSRADVQNRGQLERTLIIADEGSKVQYIEGCSAPVYSSDSLHSAVVEIVVKPSATVTHTTIQNWSSNVFNLVTKRAIVEAEGHMQWIDGNIGGRMTRDIPATCLAGPKASGSALSVAHAGRRQRQNTGATMVHAARETTSRILSKSIAKDGGRSNFRGHVKVPGSSVGCEVDVRSDALVLDDESDTTTDPQFEIDAKDAHIGSEGTKTTIPDQQLFYLMSRGLSKEQAVGMVVNGFVEPVTRTLPMEYAVEWSRLIELQMEGSVG